LANRDGTMEEMGMNLSFWQGRRVFLTGHTGFKGSWLSIWLQMLGAKVTGYALAPNTQPSLFEVADVASGMSSLLGDIRDEMGLKAAMKSAEPEIVIHMAAQPLVRYSYTHPVETYATNVMGTVHLLEAVRQTPSVSAVINVTSDKCYENREWVRAYHECDPMGGHDPYSSSKGCAELVTAAYRNSFFGSASPCAVATARAGNVIGGGDWADDRLIPDIVRAISNGQPVQIRNPHAVRPWQHVLEPLSGYLLLAEKLFGGERGFAEGWNFGPEPTDTRPVSWIVDTLTQRFSDRVGWVRDTGSHPAEAGHLTVDSTKARERLGWCPQWTLSTALDQIVDWHSSYQAGTRMRDVCERQINCYQMNSDA
jgi:CDP-glucose 4,6-dehydratase